MENNYELQILLKKYRIPQWKVADKLGYSEAKLSKKLRRELSEDDYRAISEAIDELKGED